MMMNKQQLRGFTLIELVLYFGVASLLFVSITTILLLLIQGQVKQQSIAEVEQQGVFAMNYMMRAIENADSITAPISGVSDTSLELVAVDAADDPIVFQEASGVLQVSIGGGTFEDLTSNTVTLSDLQFTNLSPDSSTEIVQITFTLERTNSSGRQEYVYSKEFQTSSAVRN